MLGGAFREKGVEPRLLSVTKELKKMQQLPQNLFVGVARANRLNGDGRVMTLPQSQSEFDRLPVAKMWPIYHMDPETKRVYKVPGKRRIAPENGDPGITYYVSGESYGLLQHRDVGRSVCRTLAEVGYAKEKADGTYDSKDVVTYLHTSHRGARMHYYISFKPGVLDIPRIGQGHHRVGEDIAHGFHAWNAFDGGSTFGAEKTATRLICTNGMISDSRERLFSVGVKHTSLSAVGQGIAALNKWLKGYEDMAEKEVEVWLAADEPLDKGTLSDLRHLLAGHGLGVSDAATIARPGNFRTLVPEAKLGKITRWDIYNAWTAFINHYAQKGENSDKYLRMASKVLVESGDELAIEKGRKKFEDTGRETTKEGKPLDWFNTREFTTFDPIVSNPTAAMFDTSGLTA
jgi:hypothetical protein